MQRYGDFGLNTNIWVFSSFVCCDRVGDLRQRSGRGFDFVGKAAMRHPDRAFFVIPSVVEGSENVQANSPLTKLLKNGLSRHHMAFPSDYQYVKW